MVEFAGDEAREASGPRSLMVFRVGPLRLGIDLARVSEVARSVPVVAPLAFGTAVVGMLCLRGVATAVIDLPALLGLACDKTVSRGRLLVVHGRSSIVCLRVDEVEAIHELEDADLQPPPPVFSGMEAPWLESVVQFVNGELIGVMDLDIVLAGISIGVEKGGVADD